MTTRPYVLLSCATSIDGYLDDSSPARLLLSNDADFHRVDQVRASCDAIMVGANTIRNDDPRLILRGREHGPMKVTLTATGDLDPAARFFTVGNAAKVVYAGGMAAQRLRAQLAGRADVVDAGDPASLSHILADLHRRGVNRLMVEGGGRLLTQFLTAGLADELQLAVAPFFVGDPAAPRFAGPGAYPWNADSRAQLAEVTTIGDVALLRYQLSERFTR